ncbi:MAG: TolC family protein [Planctomycetales bacterium]|nr:TolC family protein [Planctomycetales bacterium]
MKWCRSIRWINSLMLGSALLSTALVGCRAPREVFYLGEADLQHYKDKSLAVEYPNVDQPTPQEVVYSLKPRTIRDRNKDEVWNLTLTEAIQTAVTNNKLIRTRNAPQLNSNSPSIYDPALRETGFLFGNRGVEAALADFDATFSSSLGFGHNAQHANNTFLPNFVNSSDTSNFTSQVGKQFANGGSFAVNHNWNYLDTNSPNALFPNSYSGGIQAQYVQPLWAGAGVEYTRIAGPARPGLGSIVGVSQGVSIARINTDISVADFEASVIVMLRDVEDLYWDLYLAYRQYDADLANRDSVLRTWREVKARMEAGATGGSAGNEAQARENYFETRARVETALASVYVIENQLRRMLGLPVNDSRIIRPADDPIEVEFIVNWESSLLEALTRRVELRRQKWQIKSLELQRIAAENVTNPRLDLVSSYQVNGFGRSLASQQEADGVTAAGYNSAYSTLTRGDLTGWNLGLQFSMPIGFRQARAQLHNTELQLVKARALLSAQELDISHELAEAIQRIDAAYITAQTQLDRKIASARRVQTTQAEYEAGVKDATLDLVLRAQASNAFAEIAYFNALITYNKAITEYHLRRGTLLEHDGIQLAEGEWTEAAQEEALRRAWARSFAAPGRASERLTTEPAEFSSPVPYPKLDLYPGLPQGAEIHSITPGSELLGVPAAEPYEGPAPNEVQP